jgi:hypothetical protein
VLGHQSILNFFLGSLSERLFFGILLGISLLNIWLLPAFVTMDGPAHLYNASILSTYGESDFYRTYLDLNHWYLPNFLSHWILQLLLVPFHFLVAEKILVSLIVLLTAFSFRSLISTISGGVPIYSFLIFPILFTNLLQYGFYNFSLSFGLLNLQLLFTFRFMRNSNFLSIIFLFVNGVLLYYCHLLGFGLSMLVCGTYILVSFWHQKKLMFKNAFLLCLIHAPGIVMALLFMFSVHVPFYDYDFSPSEKSLSLVTFGPGIVFEKREEIPYTILITILLIVLSTLIIAARKHVERKFQANDFFVIISAGMIYLMYHSKNGDLGGMFVERQLCICFYFLILWAACHAPKGFITILALFTVIFEFTHVSSVHRQVSAKAQNGISEVIAAGPFIREKSVVKTVILSSHWFNSHISDYLGISREVLLLENYEAALGWFPFSWNKKVQVDNAKKLEIEPDYILIYGNDPKLQSRNDETLTKTVSEKFSKIYESRNHFCKLFMRK